MDTLFRKGHTGKPPAEFTCSWRLTAYELTVRQPGIAARRCLRLMSSLHFLLSGTFVAFSDTCSHIGRCPYTTRSAYALNMFAQEIHHQTAMLVSDLRSSEPVVLQSTTEHADIEATLPLRRTNASDHISLCEKAVQ